jgi:hypothetical protein
MAVPAEAYELYARGEITDQEMHELEKFAADLEKTAQFDLGKAGLMVGGMALAAPTLAYAANKVPKTLQGMANSMRFESGLNKAVEVNPQLGSAKDPNLRMAYKTLQTTNPEYAKDPLIAGTILDMVMSNRMDPDDPSSAPRFDPTLLNEIQKNAPRSPDMAQTMGSAAMTAAKGLEV